MRDRDVAADEIEFSHEGEGLGEVAGGDLETDVRGMDSESVESGLVKFWRGRVADGVTEHGETGRLGKAGGFVEIGEGIDGFHAGNFQMEAQARMPSRSSLAGHWPGAVSVLPR